MSGATTRIRVVAEAPYDVLVGPGALPSLAGMFGDDVRRLALIHPVGLPQPTAAVREVLETARIEVLEIAVPDGEAAKTIRVAAHCWDELGGAGFTRSDGIVGVGGGATTDLAGFVAATWLRGVACTLVPTTLLGMVDAAVGGKTAVDIASGKNLVGAFHEPAAVICDLELLATLPTPELRSGLAEVVKCGLIADERILALLAEHPREALDPTSSTLRELAERAIAVKARVVSGDLRETSASEAEIGREALNYGHTLGHAIERVEHYTRRHGEAVAIGLVFAAEVAARSGLLDAAGLALHRDVLRRVGLPTSYPGARWPELRAAMSVDKKTRGDRLRLVVLSGILHPVVLAAPDEALLVESYLALVD